MTRRRDAVLDLQTRTRPSRSSTSSRTPARGSLIIEQAFLAGVLEAREELPDLEHVIVVDGERAGGRTIALARRRGRADAGLRRRRARSRAVEPEDVADADLHLGHDRARRRASSSTHRNLLTAVGGIDEIDRACPTGARVISWLPTAHIAERDAHHYLPIVYGLQVTLLPDPRQVLAYLPEVRPDVVLRGARGSGRSSRPGLETMLAGQPEEQREPARRRRSTPRCEKVRLEQRGEPVPDELAAPVAEADAGDVRRAARDARPRPGRGGQRRRGADAASRCSSSSTPSASPLAELWGMSETCGAGTRATRPSAIKIGTVGPAAPGVELKLAEDGELLDPRRRRDARLPQPAREDGRGDRRRRLAAHRRHRRDRRRRLRQDRRPQEGADHQRGRQEHVAGEHRGDAQGRLAR